MHNISTKMQNVFRLHRGRAVMVILAIVVAAALTGIAVAGQLSPQSKRRAANASARASLAATFHQSKALAPGTFPPLPDAPQLAELRTIADNFATTDGEAAPTNRMVFTGARGIANALMSGAKVDSDQPVYVLTEHGQFTAYDASVPYGVPLPHGNTLTIVVDAATGTVTDWNISNQGIDARSLGQGMSLGG